jgi:calcineurin-like phosphoesterase family protein
MILLRDTAERKHYVTADPHLGHQKDFVWKARGFNSHDEHTEFVIETINDTCRPNDVLMVVGDLCLNTPLDKFEGYLQKIKCQNIWMLWGNHNNPHEKFIYRKMMRDLGFEDPEMELYPLRYKNLVFKGHYKEYAFNGQFTVFLHYPIAVFNEMPRGAWMLCGHSHYSYAESTAENLDTKILDVGWDGHGKPWSFEEIKAVMEAKGIKTVDHHAPTS